MASSSSASASKETKNKIFEELLDQKQRDSKTVLELKDVFNEYQIGFHEREGVINELRMQEDTAAGVGGVLYLQNSDKKDIQVMRRIVDLKKEVEEQMVVKMRYITKA
jgi:hypothetical protein